MYKVVLLILSFSVAEFFSFRLELSVTSLFSANVCRIGMCIFSRLLIKTLLD